MKVFALLLLVVGCQGSRIMPASTPALPDAGAVVVLDARASIAPVFGTPVDAGESDVAVPASSQCAEEAHEAERVPVDLLLVVDRSGSMDAAVVGGGPSKWVLAQQALSAFVKDPRSSGLSIGMLMFPTFEARSCKSDLDCGFPTNRDILCTPRQACVGAAGVTRVPVPCGGELDGPCRAPLTCQPLGRCSVDQTNCVNLGQACPAAAGTCTDQGKVCSLISADECETSLYQKSTVPFGDLPGAEGPLLAQVSATEPAGGTPTGPAVQGALAQLRARPAGHRPAMVLLTDGEPTACMGADPIAELEQLLQAARAGTPAIPTFAIGVFAPGPMNMRGPAALARWATAGGTGMPFVLAPTADLSQKLQEALNQIRGSVLACDYAIPPAQTGMIDFKRVNLHFQGATAGEDVGYVGGADLCDAVKGGWYYDIDPEAGMGSPARVVVCDATCKRFQADTMGKVQLRFGCKTRVIE